MGHGEVEVGYTKIAEGRVVLPCPIPSVETKSCVLCESCMGEVGPPFPSGTLSETGYQPLSQGNVEVHEKDGADPCISHFPEVAEP